MEVSYITTIDDFVAYNMHAFKRSPSIRPQLVLGWIMIPLACGIGAAIVVNNNPVLAGILAVVGVAYAVYFPFLQRAWIGFTVRAYAHDFGARGVIGRITLILDDETLTERTETVQSVVRWRDMKGVEVVGDCTYIYVTGLLAAIVPRHGFERPEDYEAVRDFAVGKLGTQS